jgi:murein hydrolase activator
MIRARAHFLVVLLALALLQGVAAPPGALAQSAAAVPTADEAERMARAAQDKLAERAAREQELKTVEAALASNREVRARLEAEVAAIRADRAKLNASLIETTARTQGVEAEIAALEARLAQLSASETAIRRSLEGRRALIGDVLAALQRMGRKPPPAVVVRPEDILEALRASMLLGAVVPELRSEIETLAADLTELARVRSQAATDRQAVSGQLAALAGERLRLAALVEARRLRETTALKDVETERNQGQALTGQAQGLRDFVDRIEREAQVAAKAADAARVAIESQTREVRERIAALAFRDPARLQPRASFAASRGLLPKPTGGEIIRAYGTTDTIGQPVRGISYATRQNAIISAPSDAWVAYAGPYRSYGQLLILNAGGGYYLLMAGLQRLDVITGQFVLAGEPVGVMGERQEAAASVVGVANGEPVLYVEFRKDGVAFDPGPWWAVAVSRKAGG